MAYKAVNTLDSMVGYKNARYLNFGRVSARLDDLANYIPARISGLLLAAAACIDGLDWKRALATIGRDGSSQPSPNSGVSEAAVAGALGVRLGGTNFYDGVLTTRSYIGESVHPLEAAHIPQAAKLMYVSSVVCVIAGVAATYVCHRVLR